MGKRRGLRQITAAARSLLFPPRCIGCRTLLPLSSGNTPSGGTASVFCPHCRTKWEIAMAEAAPQATRDAQRGVIYLTFYRPHRPDGIPERVIYHLKHKGDPRAFAFLASRLAPRILGAVDRLPTRAPDEASIPEGEPAAAPVPEPNPDGEARPLLFTYPPRRPSAIRENGFDQAKRLSKALALACGGEHVPLIRRVNRPAREQKSLDARGRTRNATRSYALDPRRAAAIHGRTVVICDDLCTTGATLGRCAELLVEAGAGLVVWVTVERTESGGENEG